MFESRSEFIHLQSAFLNRDVKRRPWNASSPSKPKLHFKFKHLDDDDVFDDAPSRVIDDATAGSEEEIDDATTVGTDDPVDTSTSLAGSRVEDECDAALSLRVLRTLDSIIQTSRSQSSSTSSSPSEISMEEWRLILANVILEKHIQLHVDPGVVFASGHDGAAFLEGATNSLSNFSAGFLPLLVRRMSARWLEAFMGVALQLPLGSELLNTVLATLVDVEGGIFGRRDEKGEKDEMGEEKMKVEFETEDPLEKYVVVIHHLLLFDNSSLSSLPRLVDGDDDGVDGDGGGDGDNVAEMKRERADVASLFLRMARRRIEERFDDLDNENKLKLSIATILGLSEALEDDPSPSSRVASTLSSPPSSSGHRSPRVLFPALWKYKSEIRQRQNGTLDSLAQIQGGGEGKKGFQYSFCSPQNVVNQTERISKRLRKAARFIETTVTGKASIHSVTNWAKEAATAAVAAVATEEAAAANALVDIVEIVESGSASTRTSIVVENPRSAKDKRTAAILDLFLTVLGRLADSENEFFPQLETFFRGDENIRRFANVQRPFLLRKLEDDDADEINVVDQIDGAIRLFDETKILHAKEPRLLQHSRNLEETPPQQRHQRRLGVLNRLRNALRLIRRDFLVAVEPSPEEKMSTMVSETAEMRLKRKYFRRAVEDADWIRNRLDFFTTNRKLFLLLDDDREEDLLFTFCDAAAKAARATAEECRASWADAAETIFGSLPLDKKIDFVSRLALPDADAEEVNPLRRWTERKKEAVRNFLRPTSTRQKQRLLRATTLVFNRLVGDSDFSSHQSKDFDAALDGLLDLCFRDAPATTRLLFETILTSNEKSIVVLRIVEKMPFSLRVSSSYVFSSSSSAAAAAAAAAAAPKPPLSVFQESIRRMTSTYRTSMNDKERERFKRFIVEALGGTFQPRFRHDPKNPFYDLAKWLVETLVVDPLTSFSPDTTIDSSRIDLVDDARTALDLLEALTVGSKKGRQSSKKWLTLITDGFVLVLGLLRIFEMTDPFPRRSSGQLATLESSSRVTVMSLAASIALTCGVAPKQNVDVDVAATSTPSVSVGFEWLVKTILETFERTTSLAFLGETLSIGQATPRLNGCVDRVVSAAIEEALKVRDAQFGTDDWANLMLATVVYVPEVIRWLPDATSGPSSIIPPSISTSTNSSSSSSSSAHHPRLDRSEFLLLFSTLFPSLSSFLPASRRFLRFLFDAVTHDVLGHHSEAIVHARRIFDDLDKNEAVFAKAENVTSSFSSTLTEEVTTVRPIDVDALLLSDGIRKSVPMSVLSLLNLGSKIVWAEITMAKREWEKEKERGGGKKGRREEERTKVDENCFVATLMELYSELTALSVGRLDGDGSPSSSRSVSPLLLYYLVAMTDVAEILLLVSPVEKKDDDDDDVKLDEGKTERKGFRSATSEKIDGREGDTSNGDNGEPQRKNDPLFLLLLELVTSARNASTLLEIHLFKDVVRRIMNALTETSQKEALAAMIVL